MDKMRGTRKESITGGSQRGYQDDLELYMGNDSQWVVRALMLAFVDIWTIAMGYFLALYIRFDFVYRDIPEIYLDNYIKIMPVYIACALVIFYFCRLYHSIWRFASVSEFMRIIVAFLILQIPTLFINYVWKIYMPYAFWLVGFLLSFFFVVIVRFSYRFIRSGQKILEQRTKNYGCERVMVIGAGSAGKMLIHELIMSSHLSAKACCIIDDNPAKKNRFLDGVPIVGNRHDIPDMVIKYHISKIIYAVPTTAGKDRREILNICRETGCEVQVVPGIYQMVDGRVSVSNLRPVEIEDLLGRDEVVVDNDKIHFFFEGKVVMVTGGGGSIGSELCRQIARENPKLLLIFDIYENNAYQIQQELRRKYRYLRFETLIGSVRNTNRLKDIFEKYHPDIIYHAAAHKHVPLMEMSPNEAIKNNVIGTYKLAKAAAEYGVKRFVMISTDKAVNPTNIMGASKRLCEMVVQMMNRRTETDFVAVRFGNVLGSNGSVIPLFKEQIAAGGPVTVTDPNIIRYFMTIPEAVALVLQAGLYAEGGEIFVLDMGEPVKIDDMARNLIRLSGYEPDVDIQIEYTGLRPGEKLYEEMLMNEEGLKETPNKLIHIGEPIQMDDDAFCKQLEELEEACISERLDIKEIVAKIVPTYHPDETVEA